MSTQQTNIVFPEKWSQLSRLDGWIQEYGSNAHTIAASRQTACEYDNKMEYRSPLTQHCHGLDDKTMRIADRLKLVSQNDQPPMSLAIEDTVYRAEGNANIVIALPQERSVIRFRKSLPGEVSPDGGRTRVQREVDYSRNVISRFLGSYVRIPEIVRYDAADIAKLSDAIQPLRPAERRHKTTTNTYATKFPDYAFLDLRFDQIVFRSHSTFCVEIKPKQGYLRRAEYKLPRCPYCLNQYAKLRKKNIAARSNYCPFDLFSGVEARMRNAVKELMRTPQNNLKIFKDGSVVYDHTSSPTDLENVLDEWFRNGTATTSSNARTRRTDEFCDLVCAALTQPLVREQLKLLAAAHPRNFLLPANQISTLCAEPDVVERAKRYLNSAGKSCNFDDNVLPVDSVLGRIWNMQRLSYINTNYIYDVYSKFAPLLNDDMIYSDLTRFDKGCADIVSSSVNHTNAVTEKTAVEEVNVQKQSADMMTKYSDDSNGNHGGSECIISTNAGRTVVNGGFASQTEISLNDSHRPFYANGRLHNQEANDDGDERKANTQITAEHLSALQNYLLFATARDCSILMSFRELHPENITKVPEENTIKISEQLCFLSSVRVSDLEPKSVHSIKKHRQRDVDILNSVISLLEGDNSTEIIDNLSRDDTCNDTIFDIG